MTNEQKLESLLEKVFEENKMLRALLFDSGFFVDHWRLTDAQTELGRAVKFRAEQFSIEMNSILIKILYESPLKEEFDSIRLLPQETVDTNIVPPPTETPSVKQNVW